MMKLAKPNTVGKLLKSLRRAEDMPLSFVAKHSGVSIGRLSMMETDQNLPSLKNAVKLYDFYNIKIERFAELLRPSCYD